MVILFFLIGCFISSRSNIWWKKI